MLVIFIGTGMRSDWPEHHMRHVNDMSLAV